MPEPLSFSVLTDQQKELVTEPENARIFLSGIAGSGKTTAVALRILYIMDHTAAWPTIMVLTPDQSTMKPYQSLISKEGLRPRVSSFYAFAKRSVTLFWPMIAEKAGFGKPDKSPIFLTIESAQILMAKLIKPKIENGFFNALRYTPSRIYNQILVSLNKCASAEIPYNDYTQLMKESWSGDSGLLSVFDQAQESGLLFLEICRQYNLLNYSVLLETFIQNLLPLALFQEWLRNQQIHFVFDNAEEEVPAAHHFARALIPLTRSAMIITDSNGGFRNFMGADPISAATLQKSCEKEYTFTDSYICEPQVFAMHEAITNPAVLSKDLKASPRQAFRFSVSHQYPEMIKQAAADTAWLIRSKGVSPSEIVIIAPLVSDVLYTAMERELRLQGIPAYLHRPSRPLISESYTKSLLTLITLLNPGKMELPRLLDVVQMLQSFIPLLDPMRGHILVAKTFKSKENETGKIVDYIIQPFPSLPDDSKERILAENGGRFEIIRCWINRNKAGKDTPDIAISRFFNEVLVRDGFNHSEEMNLSVNKVIESTQKFHQILNGIQQNQQEEKASSLLEWADYFDMVKTGMVSARYDEEWFSQPKNAVLISLASAFLTMNHPVKYQVWLNSGSPRWWERFYGQLTNDAVLSKEWNPGDIWDAPQAYEKNDENMMRQVSGLLLRCQRQVFIYASELDENGQDQKSKLLYVFSELSYRFGKDLPSEPPVIFDFPPAIREEEAIYPGITDEIARNKLNSAEGND